MTMPIHSPAPSAAAASVARLPTKAGIGFKAGHFDSLTRDPSPPAFIEVHAENYLGEGGLPLHQLARLRERLPLALHGVGLSIGGDAPPDEAHLDRLARVVERFEPAVFSEHLAWSSHGGNYYNDLLPIAYDTTTLARVCAHVARVQERLRRPILLENPATYLEFEHSTFDEAEFIATVVARTGCGLLLDLNNVHVTCSNHGRDAHRYLAALPLAAVAEIHLAGHAEDCDADGGRLLIDSHGGPVADPVWALYAQTIQRIGPQPTLIEWDTEVPTYARLRAEAAKADAILQRKDKPARMQAARR